MTRTIWPERLYEAQALSRMLDTCPLHIQVWGGELTLHSFTLIRYLSSLDCLWKSSLHLNLILNMHISNSATRDRHKHKLYLAGNDIFCFFYPCKRITASAIDIVPIHCFFIIIFNFKIVFYRAACNTFLIFLKLIFKVFLYWDTKTNIHIEFPSSWLKVHNINSEWCNILMNILTTVGCLSCRIVIGQQ